MAPVGLDLSIISLVQKRKKRHGSMGFPRPGTTRYHDSLLAHDVLRFQYLTRMHVITAVFIMIGLSTKNTHTG